MGSFDISSEVDLTEVRNAVDQASREVATRYDFKETNSKVELKEKEMAISLESSTDDRLAALQQVLEEKLVKRKVSLKSIEFADKRAVGQGRSALDASLKSGISQEMAKEINSFIKDLKMKGIQSSNQGDKVRVTGKKRDALQDVIAALKAKDMERPIQFDNFRD